MGWGRVVHAGAAAGFGGGDDRVTGALFGLLLPWTNNYDNGAVLLLPWQAAVAAMIGFHMASAREPSRTDPGAFAIEG